MRQGYHAGGAAAGGFTVSDSIAETRVRCHSVKVNATRNLTNWEKETLALACAGESQRDSSPKPRVAKNELPWVGVLEILTSPNGLAPKPTRAGRNPGWA